MKLVLFQSAGAGDVRPGLLTERGVVDLAGTVPVGPTPQLVMQGHGIGRMRLYVRDPLKRAWKKGISMGPDSTNPEAVRRNRPGAR